MKVWTGSNHSPHHHYPIILEVLSQLPEPLSHKRLILQDPCMCYQTVADWCNLPKKYLPMMMFDKVISSKTEFVLHSGLIKETGEFCMTMVYLCLNRVACFHWVRLVDESLVFIQVGLLKCPVMWHTSHMRISNVKSMMPTIHFYVIWSTLSVKTFHNFIHSDWFVQHLFKYVFLHVIYILLQAPVIAWESWWRHQVETFSVLLALYMQGIHQSLVNSPHEGQSLGASMFSLICTWINSWVNNPKAVDLRHHCAYYDVTVMIFVNSL